MKTLKKRIEDKVLECYAKANEIYPELNAEIATIQYNLKGKTCAGVFGCKERRDGTLKTRIKFNLEIASKPENTESFIQKTVPHEIAHHIDRLLRPRSNHDGHWQRICIALGGSGSRTCDYNTDGVGRKVKRFSYRCKCSIHELTAIRHNKCVRYNAEYICRKCRTALKRA